MPWGIESATAIAAVQTGLPAFGATQTNASPLDEQRNVSASSAFANLMQRELGALNASVGAAETALSDLAAGKSVQLHDVMISIERAHLYVQTFVQIRNKMIESYQDLMRMQL